MPENATMDTIVHEVNHSLGNAKMNRREPGWRGYNEALTEYHAKQIVSPNYKTTNTVYDYNVEKIDELTKILKQTGYGDSTRSYFDKNNPGTKFYDDLGEVMGKDSRNIVIANMNISDGGKGSQFTDIEIQSSKDRIELEISRTKIKYGIE